MEEKQMVFGADTTEKLFYQDSHMKEFTAVVVSCAEGKKGYQIVLDRTAFFPEGGGQFGDIGWLDEAVVSDTQEKNGVIFHTTDRPLAVGTTVEGRLDFEERFVRMQQHTGEHILSGIVHSLYGYDNVGFHLGADVTTLDFNGELTEEQVHRVEVLANQAVFDNIPVQILYPTKEELKSLEYRSKIEIEGQVRIVSIPGIDVCACCAPHMDTTGEIGLIKILACDKHRGGCRMTMVSGMRALADYQMRQKNVSEISVLLSAKPDSISEAVRHQKEQLLKLREHLNQLQATYLSKRLAEITGEEKNVCIFVEDFDNIAVRNFVNDAMERCGGLCGAFVGTDEGGYRYILGSKSADVRETAKKLNAAFGGKGGGKPEMVQGSLTGAREDILRLINAE
ncbi:MAG: alanyl-tRNA editing protein [Lachnospiraceae bacterium]|nr:alanyl-tRNA editing protein [Lachnospiraceae bacterium]